MMILKSKTIENYIYITTLGAGILISLLMAIIMYLAGMPLLNLILVELFLVLVLCWFISHFEQKVVVAFDRALLHIEAVKMEDYNQFARSDFKEGSSQRLHLALKDLSHHLQKNKSRYDQHAFLLYQLIDQLDTPIMVFNSKHQLSYANPAFMNIYDEPWQIYRHASPKILGLEQTSTGWRLNRTLQQWQISESAFIDNGEAHYLFVLTNIDSAIRASQLNAWQQMIRVMGHEIRNSLTPVSSLAESLSSKMQGAREQQALQLISDHCHQLQDFISRYASLSHNLNLQLTQVDMHSMWQKLSALTPDLALNTQIGIEHIHADQTFIEQVFINLLKNAHEANAKQVRIRIREKLGKVLITLADDGHGILNTDNLFVPLFTTKPNGQGIGLTFCRNIIEHHKGTIHIENNPQQGVTVSIFLPHKPLSNPAE
ncbi:sensor histidine kinase [Pseudoalteromonas phenolica]|uniref:histidine kinase n=1 Tax=Pseudoalteromonas phenolica TaxID=161398 RepID=A0A5S3YVZ7_9GAMM|nr:HAMP domain-containing sensor histidine kinase [Pseudoalteromonas phenolica]TMP81470.1 sensor histidine kinase [Pseudoalteromonas phenolica]